MPRHFSHRAPDRPDTGVFADGFMIEMSSVFEAFVSTALGVQLGAFGGRYDTQYPDTLDVAGEVRIEANLVWSHRGSPTAVIDAKYKAESHPVTPTPTCTKCSPTARH